MHFPKYKFNQPKFALRFWPELSDGACFSTNGKPLTHKDVDKQGAEVMRPVPFVNSNRNHVRFASKRKCLQWLQKLKRPHTTIMSDMLMLHVKN